MQIGGNDDYSNITNNDGKVVLFTNLTGFINPYTMSRFPNWSPKNWNPSLASLVG